jgi:hypothetical protein
MNRPDESSTLSTADATSGTTTPPSAVEPVEDRPEFKTDPMPFEGVVVDALEEQPARVSTVKISQHAGCETTPQSLSASPTAPVWNTIEPSDVEWPTTHHDTSSLSAAPYSLFAASRRGKSHAHAGTYREDAVALAGVDAAWWMIAVADGAGSCRLSRVGASITTRAACATVESALRGGMVAEVAMHAAASASRQAILAEAARRACPVEDLSSTLLLLLWVADDEGGRVCAFQAGDGLIAVITASGALSRLTEGDSSEYAGSTHFFAGPTVAATWFSRFREVRLKESHRGFLVATDGVADDLVPLSINGPIITQEVSRAAASDDPPGTLLDVIGYEKRGSFDDRTLAVAWRGEG